MSTSQPPQKKRKFCFFMENPQFKVLKEYADKRRSKITVLDFNLKTKEFGKSTTAAVNKNSNLPEDFYSPLLQDLNKISLLSPRHPKSCPFSCIIIMLCLAIFFMFMEAIAHAESKMKTSRKAYYFWSLGTVLLTVILVIFVMYAGYIINEYSEQRRQEIVTVFRKFRDGLLESQSSVRVDLTIAYRGNLLILESYNLGGSALAQNVPDSQPGEGDGNWAQGEKEQIQSGRRQGVQPAIQLKDMDQKVEYEGKPNEEDLDKTF